MTPTALPRPFALDSADGAVYFAANRRGRRFRNPWDAPPLPGARELLRWQRERVRRGGSKTTRRPVLPAARDPLGAWTASPGDTRVQWLGHASFLLETAGARILIDPVFGRAGGLVKRVVPAPLAPAQLQNLDAVLVTHGHHDHMDGQSLRALARRLGDRTVFCVPLGARRMLPRACRRVVEFDWWQEAPLGGARLAFVPAQHWHRRGVGDHNRALWGGWVIRGSETIYHSGDTGWFEGFSSIGRMLGPIDLAILPVGAYEPTWFMHSQHMNPAESVAAWRALGARHFLAMHWGTFDLTDEALDDGPRELSRLIAAQALPEERFHVLPHGGTLGLGQGRAVASG